MEKITIIVTREDEHHFSAEIENIPGAVIHRVKKATTAIGLLAVRHKKLFGIRETPFSQEGLPILEQRGKHGVHVYVNGRPDLKPEYAESFETALGQLIKKHQKEFNIQDSKHIGK